MSDRIYTSETSTTNHNFVTVAQACRGVLTKTNRLDDTQKAYDNVKYYNFFEEPITDLRSLYTLHQKMLAKPRCCWLRCRIKDKDRRRGVRRLANETSEGQATLIPGRFNWFAIDIDKFGESSGNLLADAHTVILGLPSLFWDSECFVVASSSYGLSIKPGINLRLYFWNDNPILNTELNKALQGSIVDRSIYSNPVQPIYTAAPIFDDGIDPIDVRILWIQKMFQSVSIRVEEVHAKGRPEIQYTKQQADKFIDKALKEIGGLVFGERHDGLIRWCYFLGKLVGQDHFEREDTIDKVMMYCSLWGGERNEKKDIETVTYAIDRGIASMGVGNV